MKGMGILIALNGVNVLFLIFRADSFREYTEAFLVMLIGLVLIAMAYAPEHPLIRKMLDWF